MIVRQSGDRWEVVSDDGRVLASNLATNSEAWRWIDHQDKHAAEQENTRLRIGRAFADER